MTKTTARHLSFLDRVLAELDHGLKVVTGNHPSATTPNPANQAKKTELNESESKHVAGLMRVNHCGEICAQALYRGQAMMARDEQTRAHLHQAAAEENDHLVWCQERLDQLHSRPSFLNPLWYLASFKLGATTALFGDGISLGFVVETEKQVEAHLDEHLEQLPAKDHQSRAILERMKADEVDHANEAELAGAVALPNPIKLLMKLQSKFMTTSTRYI